MAAGPHPAGAIGARARGRTGGASRAAAQPALVLAVLAAGCAADPAAGVPEGDWMHAPVPAELQTGAALFDAHCAECHGPAGTGSENGPPLVHPVYEPRHHGDGAFLIAVLQGVRGHHFRFGDMPPVDGLTEGDVARITAYVRWLQREAGIY